MEITRREDKPNDGVTFASMAWTSPQPPWCSRTRWLSQSSIVTWSKRNGGALSVRCFTGSSFKVVVVVHTFPGGDELDWVHIISMHPADAGERRRYEQVSHR
jgi:uncharacterized DUF497 family protein